jgi:hypothetical protein
VSTLEEPRPGECWVSSTRHVVVCALWTGRFSQSRHIDYVDREDPPDLHLWCGSTMDLFLTRFTRCTQHPPRLGDAAFHGEASGPPAEGPPWPPADE